MQLVTAPLLYRDRAAHLLGRIAERLSFVPDPAGGFLIRDLTWRERQLAETYDRLLDIIAPDDAERGTW